MCIIQHRNRPLGSTALNAHDTNASPDGPCGRTHTNEAFSCWFCCKSFRVDRARRDNVCFERHGWAVFQVSKAWNIRTRYQYTITVFILFWKKICRETLQPTLGRPNVYHVGPVPETCCKRYYCCQARSSDGGTGKVCGGYGNCGTCYE